MKKKILVSIVNHCTDEDTLALVKSLVFDSILDKVSYKLLIIDNSPKSLSRTSFEKKLYEIINFDIKQQVPNSSVNKHCLCYADNKGYTGAHNLSLNYAEKKGFDLVWIINNDLDPDKNCVNEVLKIIHLPYTVFGSIVYEEKEIFLGTNGISSFKSYGTPAKSLLSKQYFEVEAAIGTSMFVKVSGLKGVRFDEDFFTYVEETDFCHEINKMGGKCVSVSNSFVIHEGGGTFQGNQGLRWYYKTRNLLYFRKKNGYRNHILILYLALVTLKKFGINFRVCSAFFLGVKDYLASKKGKTSRIFI